MITVINKILGSSGFGVVEVASRENSLKHFLYKAESSERQEYFLTIDLSALDQEELKIFLEQTCQEIFEEILNSGNVELHFEKNCTMIICIDTSSINQDLTLAIEEDPYNFKKNVIKYTADELTELNSYLSTNSVKALTNDAINDILNANGGTDFLEFKKNRMSGSQLYSLVTRIIIKLPFLVYTPRKQKLENLAGQIEEAVPVELRETLHRILATEWTDDAIIVNAESIWGDQA